MQGRQRVAARETGRSPKGRPGITGALAGRESGAQLMRRDTLGQVLVCKVATHLAEWIGKERRSAAARFGGQEVASLPDLRIGVGVSIDIEEVHLLLIALRNATQGRMIVSPSVISDSHETRVQRACPAVDSVPIEPNKAGSRAWLGLRSVDE